MFRQSVEMWPPSMQSRQGHSLWVAALQKNSLVGYVELKLIKSKGNSKYSSNIQSRIAKARIHTGLRISGLIFFFKCLHIQYHLLT